MSTATVALPLSPRNTSPVPHLTSIHSSVRRGEYGSHTYPGNCGGYLIRDLLQYFKPNRVFDPMTGSGTCRDVCRELNIECFSGDIRRGFDAGNAEHVRNAGKFDFVWIHPPYWRMKKYTDDPNDLSNAPTMLDFYKRLEQVIVNCRDALTENGKLAILMGDYRDMQEHKFIPCVHMTREACLRNGLWPACTEIIRFQHGNSSSKKNYTSSFIPGLHDVCMIVERTR